MADSEFKERIRREVPIDAYIGKFVHLKKSGRSYVGLCPFHKEKTPSFHVNREGGYYHCFGCKASGDIFRFAMDYHKVDFPRSLELLSEFSGIPLQTSRVGKEIDARREDSYRLNQKVLGFYKSCLFSKEGEKALSYLEERGLSREEIELFSIGYAPEGFGKIRDQVLSGEYEMQLGIELGILRMNERGQVYDFFRNRILFPILDFKGRVIGFSGRKLSSDPNEPKYINSSNSHIYDKKNQIYNLFLAQDEIRSTRQVFIVEGVLDAIGLFTRGIRNVVAPLGTSFTENQARLLRNLSDTATLIMDGDPAGVKGAARAGEILLKEGFQARVVVLPEGKDPFDLSRSLARGELRRVLEGAVSAWDFLLSTTLGEVNPRSSPERKKKALASLFAFVRRWERETDRQILLTEAASRLGFKPESLYEDFRREKEQFPYGKTDTYTVERSENLELQPKGSSVQPQSSANRRAVECERSILAKVICNPELIKWAQAIDNLEFLDTISVVLWEWIFTKYHSGESFSPAEVLSSESLPDGVRKAIAPYLLAEESAKEEDLDRIFEEMILRQEIFFHEREMDRLILESGDETNTFDRLTLVAKHKAEVQKRKEYLRSKTLIRS